MIRPDDSILTPPQLATVRRHADRLLREASALDRFPTPIDDIMAAAKLTVVDDEVLNETVLSQFLSRARAGLATIRSALSKVLGLFESNDRLVVVDRAAPKPRVPFIKLHEAGHGTLPHQSKVYRLIHDCEQTLNPDITELFEREANVFASEALFQGEVFAREARDLVFSIKTPIALARKFGASNYATFRRYVIANSAACCVVVLEPAVYRADGRFTAEVRRIVMSKSFEIMYDGRALSVAVTGSHPLAPAVPMHRRRMVYEQEIVLADRNGDERRCIAEGFDTKHQVLILIRDSGVRARAGILVPSAYENPSM